MDKRIDKVDKNFKTITASNNLKYYDVQNSDNVKVYGLNWFESDKRYVRFPESSDETINGLNDTLKVLVHQPSGGCVAFYSDTTNLSIEVTLGQMFNMAHMAYTGQGGVDLYIGNQLSDLTFFKTSTFYEKNYQFTFFKDLKMGRKLYLLNLPLYAQVLSVKIGVDEKASITPATLFDNGRIVWYGTSITQGGCASRPGMCPSNLIARKLNYEVLNYGFSGHGRGEEAVAKILAEIKDVSLFIIDYEANATYEMLTNTFLPFISTLRRKYPVTPILVISKISMAIDRFNKTSDLDQQKRRKFQRQVVAKLAENDPYIYFYNGQRLLSKSDHEVTVDGCHPTDLGFYFFTKRLLPVIKKILKL